MENRLLLNINLGSRRTGMTEDHNQETSLSLGSILDDNVFHEVMIARDKWVKCSLLTGSRPDLYIGGMPYVQRGLVIYENFTGCMENLYLNHSNVFAVNADRAG